MTSVDGLFAAGSSSGLEGCSYACSSGFYAGNRAVEYGKKVSLGEVDEAQLDAEIKRVHAPVRRTGDPGAYVSWKELWGGSARVMQQCCGDFKTISILEHGLTWLDSIKKNEMQRTYARNPHELARVMEDETRITVSEMFLHACIIKIRTDASDLPGGTMCSISVSGTRWSRPTRRTDIGSSRRTRLRILKITTFVGHRKGGKIMDNENVYIVPNVTGPTESVSIDPEVCVACNACANICRTQTIMPNPRKASRRSWCIRRVLVLRLLCGGVPYRRAADAPADQPENIL